MRLIDEQYTKTPFYGVPRMCWSLRQMGHLVNEKRVSRLMRLMGLQAIYPRKNLSVPAPGHKIYPYLLRGLKIDRPNQVWSTDITYIRMIRGFLYLCAVIDWNSRLVLSWRLSNTLDGDFCIETLQDALNTGAQPEIFNTDQGSQFTSPKFTKVLLDREIRISMDGRGRALDNVSASIYQFQEQIVLMLQSSKLRQQLLMCCFECLKLLYGNCLIHSLKILINTGVYTTFWYLFLRFME
jgi:putative transposase